MTSKYKYQGNPRKPKLGTEKCKCGLSEFAHKQSDYWRTNKACEKFQPEDEIVTTDYETKPEIDAFVKGFMKGKQKKGSSEDVPDCEKYDKDILGKHTLTKQKKGSSEDVPKEIINPMKDMVRNGKDWKQKGCNCYGICLDKSCSNQSPQRRSETPNKKQNEGTQTLSDIKEIIGIPIDEVIEVLEIYKRNKSLGRN